VPPAGKERAKTSANGRDGDAQAVSGRSRKDFDAGPIRFGPASTWTKRTSRVLGLSEISAMGGEWELAKFGGDRPMSLEAPIPEIPAGREGLETGPTTAARRHPAFEESCPVTTCTARHDPDVPGNQEHEGVVAFHPAGRTRGRMTADHRIGRRSRV